MAAGAAAGAAAEAEVLPVGPWGPCSELSMGALWLAAVRLVLALADGPPMGPNSITLEKLSLGMGSRLVRASCGGRCSRRSSSFCWCAGCNCLCNNCCWLAGRSAADLAAWKSVCWWALLVVVVPNSSE